MTPGGGEILVLYARTAGVSPDEIARRIASLHVEERERAMRFIHESDRLNFATGRLIARSVLGPSRPFSINAYGKPDAGLDVRFNISHTAGMVAVGFAFGREIGVDIERIDRRTDLHGVARSYFARRELEWFESLAPDRRSQAFFGLWTLKEAYIKARGMGLSIPLASFVCTLDPPAIADDAGHWFLWQGAPEPGYVFAVAAHREVGERLAIRVEEFVPA